MRRALLVLALLPGVVAAQTGGFTAVPATLPFDETRYLALAPADVDGDGDLDVLVAFGDQPNAYGSTRFNVQLYRNDGLTALGRLALVRVPFPFAPVPEPLFGRPPSASLSWADVDGDGDVDAFVGTHAGSAVYRNDGGTFVATNPLVRFLEFRGDHRGLARRSSAWGDVDNDGDLDLATTATFGDPNGWYTQDSTAVVLYRNAGGVLALDPAPSPFQALRNTEVAFAWGDLEPDGDLDLLTIDRGSACDHYRGADAAECLVLYRNDGGTLTALPYDFPEVEYADADLADFDSDGDLDVLLVGRMFNNTPPDYFYDRAIVYRNDGGTFTPDTLVFPFPYSEEGFELDQARWADYDGDGDVDILVGGAVDDYGGPGQDFGAVAFVFSNEGGTFVLRAALDAPSLFGATAWADMDLDGDLDLLVVGLRGGPNGGLDQITRLYRNDTPMANAPPSPPDGLTASVDGDAVTLAWAAAEDDHTAAASLTYSLRVSALDGGDIVSPMSRSSDGGRLVPEPGNVSLNRRWTLRGLAPGTYVWTVQAVDNAFNGGGFAEGGTFSVGAVGTEPASSGPAVLVLSPNPTAHAARAALTLPAPTRATVAVFDALGRRVALLAEGELAAGEHVWPLDAARLAPGVYTVRVDAAGAAPLVGRLVIVR